MIFVIKNNLHNNKRKKSIAFWFSIMKLNLQYFDINKGSMILR